MTTVRFGYWTEKVDEEMTNPLFKYRFYCSECGNWQSYGRTLFCPNCGAKMKMTNGDRIRAMTNEELMEWMADHVDCGEACPVFYLCRRTPMENMSCEDWILEWLKTEVKK